MLRSTKSRLLATSAVAGFAAQGLAMPAHAQVAFGIHVDSSERETVVVEGGETVSGTVIGVYADNGPVTLTVEENGEINSEGTDPGSQDVRSEGGVVIAQPDSSVTNSGLITSTASGVTTTYFFGEDENDEPLPPQPLTRNTKVTNTSTGQIVGTGGHGIQLLGGGSVTNDGLIRGTGIPGSTGVFIAGYPDRIDEGVTGIGSLVNGAGGVIEGGGFGVLLSGGGTIDNAGTIRSLNQQTAPGSSPFGVILSATEGQEGREATLTNSGSISGLLGMLVQGTLVSTTIENSGQIRGDAVGMFLNAADGVTTVNNLEGGSITGSAYAIRANTGTVAINNGANATIAAQVNAIEVVAPGTAIDNAGTIDGGQYGIVTLFQEGLPLAIGTQITNSGSIIGRNNDAIRLAGGGSVTNSGDIFGLAGEQTDGISMFAFPAQSNEDFSASVVNSDTGSIYGARFGVILSGGGEVANEGLINSAGGGIFIQGIAVNSEEGEDRSGQTGTVTNTGSIYGNSADAVGFGSNLSSATLTNSGLISTVSGAGVLQGSLGDVTVTNLADGEIYGGTSGVLASSSGTLTVDNAGLIRGNGTYDGFEREPDAGIAIGTANSSVVNSGTISGAGAGITTFSILDSETNTYVGLAIGTTITNSGEIYGENNDAIRLIGGGSVINSGEIIGFNGAFTDGISMYAFPEQANEDFSASVVNSETGTITGSRFGVILSGGGEVTNDGTISANNGGGVLIQGIALNSAEGEDRSGLSGTVTNTGTITGVNDDGVGFGSDLATATLVNSGTISSTFAAGVFQGSLSDATFTNLEGGTITGGTSGILASSSGTVAIDNAGTIRGNGTSDSLDFPPDAGITIATANSSVVNSGTISGAGAGISTAYIFDTELDRLVGIAIGTTVSNSGTISGEANDGIRLIGGGSVTNSGSISGFGTGFADGISMFRFDDQAGEGYAAEVANLADGEIAGERFAIILSGGGSVENAGVLTGGLHGVQLQSQGDGPGQAALLVNSGSIEGEQDAGVVFAGSLETASIENSGSITGAARGVVLASAAPATLANTGTITGTTEMGVLVAGADVTSTIVNGTDGIITGGTSGIVVQEGAIDLINAGQVRGEGTPEAPTDAPNGGIRLQSGENSITNTGSITGAQFGVVTTQYFNPETQALEWRTGNNSLDNSGTITGETNDGVSFLGGGTIVNRGLISGGGSDFADGVQLQHYPGRDNGEAQIGSVVNEAGGVIEGDRFGIILAGGGTIENAGTIRGGVTGALLVSSNFLGKTGSINNSGTIEGGVLVSLQDATIANSGTITGNIAVEATTIEGAVDPSFYLRNDGTLTGSSGIAILTGSSSDVVELTENSIIAGIVDLGDGMDALVLDFNDDASATAIGQVAETLNVERLSVDSGNWRAETGNSVYDLIEIEEGTSLTVAQANGFIAVSAPVVELDGTLNLELTSDTEAGELDGLTIAGSGSVVLSGPATLLVDNASGLQYTGGTFVQNGTLLLTDEYDGDITTSGDGVFQLGDGGTTGDFTGNLQNEGTFVFNRSDDYELLGDFNGAGSLVKDGAGTLFFGGEYGFTGTTTVRAGVIGFSGAIDPEATIDLSSGATFDLSRVQGGTATLSGLTGSGGTLILGSSNLTVTQDGDSSFSGSLQGTGSFSKTGTGDLKLEGDSPNYTGQASISGGTLSVNGNFANATFLVQTGGTLGGNGTLGPVTISGGTFAPGNSIDMINVAGNLAFTAASIYEVEVNAAGQSDRVNVSGSATLGGASVSVLAANGRYSGRTDYTILTAAGGLNGTFGSVTSNLAFLTPTLSYTGNDVTLTLTRNNVDFLSAAVNANQQNVAAALQSLGGGNAVFEEVLLLTDTGASVGFQSVSGELFPATTAALVESNQTLKRQMLQAPQGTATGVFGWATGLGSFGSADASAITTDLKTRNVGGIAGIGFGSGGFDARIGVGATDGNVEQNGSADVNSRLVIGQVGFGGLGGFSGKIGASYTWHDVETRRSAAIGLISNGLSSAYDADSFMAYGEVDYLFPLGSLAVGPTGGFSYVRTETGAFAETGGALALNGAQTSREVTFGTIGLKLEGTGAVVRPMASAQWRHAWGDLDSPGSFAFSTGDAFTGFGPSLQEDAAEVRFGLELGDGPVTASAGYVGLIGGDWEDHSAQISIKVAF